MRLGAGSNSERHPQLAISHREEARGAGCSPSVVESRGYSL